MTAENERREHLRKRTLRSAKIFSLDFAEDFDCTVRDVTDVGARVRVAMSPRLQRTFYLLDLASGIAYDAEVVWRREDELGVVFRNSRSVAQEAELKILRRVWESRRPR